MQVDVESLLAAIPARTSEEIGENMDEGQPPRLEVEDRFFLSCLELAKAFKIDISNYRA